MPGEGVLVELRFVELKVVDVVVDLVVGVEERG